MNDKDLRSLARKRAYLAAKYGPGRGPGPSQPTSPGARAQTPTSTSGAGDPLLELQRRWARLPQTRQPQGGGQESREQRLQRYQAILAKMPEGEGRRLLQRSINQLRNKRTVSAPGRAQARHSMMEKR